MTRRIRQRGQALVEALVVAPVLILSFLAVAWLGQLVFRAQAAAVAARSAAMIAAASGPVQARSGALALTQASVVADDPGFTPLQAQWLGADARLVSVTAHAAVAGVGPWGGVRLERRTRVAAGAGNADGDDDARRRIGAAAASWTEAAEGSVSLAREISDMVSMTDGPWDRPDLSLDWLSAWADVVPAAGSASASPAGLHFPPGSRVESLADRLWLNGAPMQAWVFEAPVDVPEMIHLLSRQQAAFSDLQILPGQAILSGWVDDALWVAQLTSPEAGRSVGSVSSIVPAAIAARNPPVWLPADARLMLDVAVEQGQGAVAESIWRHDLAPSQLAPLLRQGLSRAGWRDGDSDRSAGWQAWRRRAERLEWMLTPLDAGSGLWIRRWTS